MTGSVLNWTDIATAATAITAVVALILSAFSLYYARGSLALAKVQDRRREPKLSAEFVHGDYVTDHATGSRRYRIRISIGNSSDSDNSLSRAEFRLAYRLSGGAEMTARLQQASGEGQLQLPIRITAHETVAGRCEFVVPCEIIEGNRIEGYEIEFGDTHGQVVSVIPLLLSEHPHGR